MSIKTLIYSYALVSFVQTCVVFRGRAMECVCHIGTPEITCTTNTIWIGWLSRTWWDRLL
jgi:hypothetical protein